MPGTSSGRRRRRSTPRSSSTRSRARGRDTAQARSERDPCKDTSRENCIMSTTETEEAPLTARNRPVDVDGATLVYRRVGNAESQAPPLLCLQHFRGNLDNWDPALIDRIAAITMPALVANGDNDPMMIAENSYLLAHHLPNAQLRIYPDAGHGFLDQYPEQFADHVNAFLGGG